MKITVLGVLVALGVVALVVYAAQELGRQMPQSKPVNPPKNPDSSINHD